MAIDEDKPWLTYPAGRGGYTLYVNNVTRLQNPQRFLDDNLINLLMIWAKNNLLEAQEQTKVRLVDSQWFDQMIKDVQEGQETSGYAANLERLKRWFPAGHPFDKPLVIIPVCLSYHWVVATAILDNNQWVVTCLDSFAGGIGTKVQKTVAAILQCANPEKNVVHAALTVQQQGNSYDCGLHTVTNGARMMHTLNNHVDIDWEDLEANLNRTPCPLSQKSAFEIISAIKNGTKVTDPIKDILRENQLVQSLVEALNLSESENESEPVAAKAEPEVELDVIPHYTLEPGTERGHGNGVPITNKRGLVMVLAAEEDWAIGEVVHEARRDIGSTTRKRFHFLRTIKGWKLLFKVRSNGTVHIIVKGKN